MLSENTVFPRLRSKEETAQLNDLLLAGNFKHL